MSDKIEPMGNGPWKEIESGSAEESADRSGFTHPNLHRRLSTDTEGRKYSVGIYGLNSYRTTTIELHDEESTDSEIP